MQEIDNKLTSLRYLMEEAEVDSLLLQRTSSFSWATCGADPHINTAASEGGAALLITHDHRYLLTDNIEASRLQNEENLDEQGWSFQVLPWYETGNKVRELTAGKKLGTDGLYPEGKDLSVELAWLRAQLSRFETERFKVLGELCAKSMKDAAYSIQPGMTEYKIAGVLSQAAESRGVQAVVNLIGTDERIFRYRHPLPTDKKLDRYAMLILCGRKWGLICSISRLVYFGEIPEEIRIKSMAVAEIDARMISNTRPGKNIADVFSCAQEAYSDCGYPDEWKKHHQGGLAGYEPREVVAAPGINKPVRVHQTYAWNPSITGSKSEDTILVSQRSNEILTTIPGWPSIDVSVNGGVLTRPDILVRQQG